VSVQKELLQVAEWGFQVSPGEESGHHRGNEGRFGKMEEGGTKKEQETERKSASRMLKCRKCRANDSEENYRTGKGPLVEDELGWAMSSSLLMMMCISFLSTSRSLDLSLF